MNEKWFRDRRNCLKSKLKSAKGVKLTKVINEKEVALIEGALQELDYIQYKFKIHI
jgi:hypothetical protein